MTGNNPRFLRQSWLGKESFDFHHTNLACSEDIFWSCHISYPDLTIILSHVAINVITIMIIVIFNSSNAQYYPWFSYISHFCSRFRIPLLLSQWFLFPIFTFSFPFFLCLFFSFLHRFHFRYYTRHAKPYFLPASAARVL